MPIKHIFSSGKGPSINPNLVDGDNWNQDHLYPAFLLYGHQLGDDARDTLAPGAAVEELYGIDFRTKVDLTYVDDVRVVAYSFANNNNVPVRLGVQYSLDGAAWDWLNGVDGPYVVMDPTGPKASAWAAVTGAAKTDVWLRWVSQNGTGINLQWNHHYLQGR